MILGSVALIISVFESHPTFGSSNMRGPFGFVNGGDNGLTNAAAPSEMCATCVTIRGYKCQEYEVLTQFPFENTSKLSLFFEVHVREFSI